MSTEVLEGYLIQKIYNDKSAEQYLKQLKSWIITEQNILNDFIFNKKPENEFINCAKFNILDDNANYLVSYLAYGSDSRESIKEVLFDLSFFQIDNDSAIISSF